MTEDLQEVVEKYYSLNAQVQSIQLEIEHEKKEIRELEESLKQDFPLGSPSKNIVNLEKEIQSYNTSIQIKLYKLGDGFYNQNELDQAFKKEIISLKKEISSLDNDNKNYGLTIEKLEAAINVDKLNNKLSQADRKILSLQEEIKHAQSSIKEQESQKVQLNEEKNKYIQLAGDQLNQLE